MNDDADATVSGRTAGDVSTVGAVALDTTTPDAFRSDLRDWLSRSVPGGLREVYDWRRRPVRHTPTDRARLDAQHSPEYASWERELLAASLICPQWPAQFGGRDLDPVLLMVLNEEFARAGVPRIVRHMGEGLVGPALLRHGTPEQKSFFLPRIVDGRDEYCQGYSERDSGSDLASLSTRGVVDGDDLVIDGHKIWTSHATESTMMFLLCRTGDSALRHRSLTYVLVDVNLPGFQIAPITEMSGAAGFAECFLDSVRVPLFNVVNGIDGGWAPAMTSLGYERSGDATTAYLAFQNEVEDLIDFAYTDGPPSPALRQELAWAWAEVITMRAMGVRTAADLIADRVPGPEGLVHKLFWSEFHRRFGEIAVQVCGPEALVRSDSSPEALRRWQDVFMLSRSETIFAGTSEIQRNTIAERGLGLPR